MWSTLTYDEIIFLLYEIFLHICPPLLGNLKSTSPFSSGWVFQEPGEWLTTALKINSVDNWVNIHYNNEMVDGTQLNDFPLGRETQLTAGGISCYVDQTGAQWGVASDRGD